jgi:hypothetical protein
LGFINYLKIWHDNTGEENNASWYLKHLIVKDLQTNEEFLFVCEQWFALEKGDAKLERRIFVACEPQQMELKNVFKSNVQLNQKHLWLSIFNRPVNSPFSRLDRVTCGFVFLYVSVLLNLLYYRQSKLQLFESNKIDFAFFYITTEQVDDIKFFNILL